MVGIKSWRHKKCKIVKKQKNMRLKGQHMVIMAKNDKEKQINGCNFSCFVSAVQEKSEQGSGADAG